MPIAPSRPAAQGELKPSKTSPASRNRLAKPMAPSSVATACTIEEATGSGRMSIR
jgi:hypothetical protein